jgi:hypothetical protein
MASGLYDVLREVIRVVAYHLVSSLRTSVTGCVSGHR